MLRRPLRGKQAGRLVKLLVGSMMAQTRPTTMLVGAATLRQIVYFQEHLMKSKYALKRVAPLLFRSPAVFHAETPKPSSGPSQDNEPKKEGAAEDPEDEESMSDKLTHKVILGVAAVFVTAGVIYYLSWPHGTHTGWESILPLAEDIASIDVYRNYVQFTFSKHPQMYVGVVDDDHTATKIGEVKAAMGKNKENVVISVRGISVTEQLLKALGVVAWIVPFLFVPTFIMILTRTMASIANVASTAEMKSKINPMMFSVVNASSISTRFKDVAGMIESKREIVEIVDFLKTPDRFQRLGATIPTGALLLGPPGTGKTLLAKAVAGEAGVAFIPCCGSDFVEMYVGMGAMRIRELFSLAKQQRCIIYIDEIDAIGMRRGGEAHGESLEAEHTLNELLTQLDGFDSHPGDIMVLASTNIDIDRLDPALVRPGRFDRIVHVDPPVHSERQEVFKVHLSKIKVDRTGTSETEVSTVVDDFFGEKLKLELTSNHRWLYVPLEVLHRTEAVDDCFEVFKGATRGFVTEFLCKEKGNRDQLVAELKASPEGRVASLLRDVVSPSDELLFIAYAILKLRAAEGTTPTVDDQSKGMIVVNNPAVALAKAEKTSENENWEKDHPSTEAKKAVKKLDDEPLVIKQYAERMSNLCPGFVGSDIMNVCNEAAILATRERAPFVTLNHLERSIDRVLAGIEQRSRILTPFEKKVVAHHEAGHAVAGWFLNRADPLMKVSIVPRGGSALGYAQYLPNENNLKTSQEILDGICVALGGRVAEKLFFDHWSTGASDDLSKVTKMAFHYVSHFGSSTAHPPPGSTATKYVKPFGQALAEKFDVAMKKLVDECFDKTVKLLSEHKEDMKALARHLLEHEMMTHADVVKLLGSRASKQNDFRSNV